MSNLSLTKGKREDDHVLPSLQTISLTFDPFFVGRDGSALDADIVFEDGFGRVDRHLIIGLVAMRKPKVVVEAVEVKVGEDQLQGHIEVKVGRSAVRSYTEVRVGRSAARSCTEVR